MKYTQNTLDKLESIAEQNGYVIRFERGTFQSGYCILQQQLADIKLTFGIRCNQIKIRCLEKKLLK